MAAFFQRVFVEETTFNQQILTDGERAGASMSPVDLAGELVGGTSTCEELGQQAFDFFKVYQYARKLDSDNLPETVCSLLSPWFAFVADVTFALKRENTPASEHECALTHAQIHSHRRHSVILQMVQRALSTEADTGPETSTPTQESVKPPRNLNLDGVVLRAGIWAAAAVDNWKLSLGVLLVCLLLVASLCGAILGGCRRRRLGRHGSGSWTRKERKGVKVHGMPQRVVAANREKTA